MTTSAPGVGAFHCQLVRDHEDVVLGLVEVDEVDGLLSRVARHHAAVGAAQELQPLLVVALAEKLGRDAARGFKLQVVEAHQRILKLRPEDGVVVTLAELRM